MRIRSSGKKNTASSAPSIDAAGTGRHFRALLDEYGLTVKDVQRYLGLSCPQGIYRWLSGQSLPSVDNLYALQGLFQLPMDRLLCGSFYSDPSASNSDRRISSSPSEPFDLSGPSDAPSPSGAPSREKPRSFSQKELLSFYRRMTPYRELL